MIHFFKPPLFSKDPPFFFIVPQNVYIKLGPVYLLDKKKKHFYFLSFPIFFNSFKLLISLYSLNFSNNMGLLSFRKKNKKIDRLSKSLRDELPELTFEQRRSSNDGSNSGSSSASFNSPIADLFIMASSISDIASTSLLEDILSELPKKETSQKHVYNGK